MVFDTDCAMFCSSIVLPVRGGATMRPRWPLPIGVRIHYARGQVLGRRFEPIRVCGYNGVSFQRTASRLPGASKLTAST